MNRIVIIGGMGPQASLELHRRIIASAALAGAKDNEDYPEILHVSIPVPDFISSGNSAAGLRRIRQSLEGIQLDKDDKLILACNTAHLLLPTIEADYKVRFISLIDATVDAIKHLEAKTVGLLSSPTTIKMQLYEKPIRAMGGNVVLPTEEEIDELEEAIRHILANNSPGQVLSKVELIVQRMLRDGAQQVILGCTELSVIFKNTKNDKLIDPLNLVCRELNSKTI